MKRAIVLLVFLLLLGCASSPTAPQNNTPLSNASKGKEIVNTTFIYHIGNQTVPPDEGTAPENISGNATPESNATENVTPQENITPEAVSDRIQDSHFNFITTPNDMLFIYVIDVGNGDAILLKKGFLNILVDGGDSAHGETVADFLSYLGIDNLQIVVATHTREENIGGLPTVLNSLHVEELWNNNVTSERPEYVNLMSVVSNKKIPVKHPSVGDSLWLNGINMTVLNPQKERYGSDANPDPDSIALRIDNGNFCMLLMSDVDEGAQPAIMASNANLKCDVLLVPKHGSGNAVSDLFLLKVAPSQAVISVGQNSVGYPNPTTITRLGLKGITVYRTDLNGTILVTSDGLTHTVQKFVKTNSSASS